MSRSKIRSKIRSKSRGRARDALFCRAGSLTPLRRVQFAANFVGRLCQTPPWDRTAFHSRNPHPRSQVALGNAAVLEVELPLLPPPRVTMAARFSKRSFGDKRVPKYNLGARTGR